MRVDAAAAAHSRGIGCSVDVELTLTLGLPATVGALALHEELRRVLLCAGLRLQAACIGLAADIDAADDPVGAVPLRLNVARRHGWNGKTDRRGCQECQHPKGGKWVHVSHPV